MSPVGCFQLLPDHRICPEHLLFWGCLAAKQSQKQTLHWELLDPGELHTYNRGFQQGREVWGTEGSMWALGMVTAWGHLLELCRWCQTERAQGLHQVCVICFQAEEVPGRSRGHLSSRDTAGAAGRRQALGKEPPATRVPARQGCFGPKVFLQDQTGPGTLGFCWGGVGGERVREKEGCRG